MSLLFRIWIVFWPCDDCYSSSFIFAQIYFCCLKLPCTEIYKAHIATNKVHCFTQDLGPLHPSFHQLQSPGPSYKDGDIPIVNTH